MVKLHVLTICDAGTYVLLTVNPSAKASRAVTSADLTGCTDLNQQHSSCCMLQAFTRCAQQEPDHGEAWNNIAAIHLQLQHPAEAFSALSEAVKYKRDSWQTWANYGQAAAQTGNNLPAVRAVQKARLCSFASCCHPGNRNCITSVRYKWSCW